MMAGLILPTYDTHGFEAEFSWPHSAIASSYHLNRCGSLRQGLDTHARSNVGLAVSAATEVQCDSLPGRGNLSRFHSRARGEYCDLGLSE